MTKNKKQAELERNKENLKYSQKLKNPLGILNSSLDPTN